MEKKSSETEEQDTECSYSTIATKVMLVTANVGSLFEDPERLLKPWLKEFLSKVSQLHPEFLALHLQEVGGKTYEKSMECVQQFIKNLCEAEDLRKYTSIQIFMDEDFRSAEHFTALGNLYFIAESLTAVKIWNFLTRSWEVSRGKNIFTGNIEAIGIKEKSKFPQHFFPECKWSRKGFMRTRWEVNGTVMDLVNIHLFHDASNLAACEEFPSVYCKTRRRALVHTLERFHLDNENGVAPFFLFGDFNFRCDAEGVIKELTENLTAHRIHNTKHDSTKVHYRNAEGNNVLILGKKEFVHADHQLKFKETWLRRHDKELEPLRDILYEYPIDFSPTYPYEEDPDMPTDYMSTRCPSWCDRILMSLSARKIVKDELEKGNPYNTIGENICMGDHKPIYLHFKLKPKQGTYISCKCYLSYSAKSHKSTSHNNFQVSSEIIELKNDLNYCFYSSEIYNQILRECSRLDKLPSIYYNEDTSYAQHALKDFNNLPPALAKSSQMNSNFVLKELNHPHIRINIFDSDNINVCLCSEIADSAADNIDGTICHQCRNIIKKQSQNQRCALISKRLVLANDIIVNRIDTHYLNTNFDYIQQQEQQYEPYTPESNESHSPCPELNSVSTTSSINPNNTENHSDIEQNVEENSLPKLNDAHSNDNPSPSTIVQNSQDNLSDSPETSHKRGVVSPGQLKSILEDLQRSSLNNLNVTTCDGDDVVDVVEITSSHEKTFTKKHKNNCLSGCCNIC